ncbi:MAG: ParB N-terminal domain-containing protein [Planctomycetota bacterium]|nr:ParB N-terminal domain-containing protein [Planctomycetota bacterium]
MATRKRRKKVEPESRGLSPIQVAGNPPKAVEALKETIEEDGGRVLGCYRDPLGGMWQCLVALPIDIVAPTPFQRDLSAAHVKRLSERIDQLDRFLDPIIAVRNEDGGYWTPNGNHRLSAMRELGAKTITALVIPEREMAYQILALNTEKAHNLREKSFEVIRMARDLATVDPGPEKDYAGVFEEPSFLTLGCCYEKNGRFSGGVYNPVLKRVEAFLGSKLPKALEVRDARAAMLFELDEAVVAVVTGLKERGFDSPYLKNFVVARINPLRFKRDVQADFDETVGKMLKSAQKFDVGKIKADQVAKSGGPADAS